MQHLKNFNWKKFLLQGVLPFLLAVAVGSSPAISWSCPTA